MKFGLKEETIKRVCSVFSKYAEVEQVILYGSRTKGNYKTGSDIDLTIKGSHLSLALVNKISNELDDLLLPYTFDLSIFTQIDNSELIDHINRIGTVFYEKDRTQN